MDGKVSSGTLSFDENPVKVDVKFSISGCVADYGGKVSTEPSPEIVHVVEDLRCFDFRDQSVVWRDDDGVVLESQVENPRGEPGRKVPLAEDLYVAWLDLVQYFEALRRGDAQETLRGS